MAQNKNPKEIFAWLLVRHGHYCYTVSTPKGIRGHVFVGVLQQCCTIPVPASVMVEVSRRVADFFIQMVSQSRL